MKTKTPIIQKVSSKDKRRAALVDKILKKLEPRLAKAFAEGIRNVRDKVILKKIIDAIEGGNPTAALRLIDPT